MRDFYVIGDECNRLIVKKSSYDFQYVLSSFIVVNVLSCFKVREI